MTHRATQVVAFFVLAYLFSWFGLLGNALWPSDAWPVPINPLGPLMAAPLVLWWFGGGSALRDWARRMLRVAAPAWVYAVAVLIPLGLILGSIGVAMLMGVPHVPLPDYGLDTFLVGVPLVALDGPLPEELSFRGFGQHWLQQEMSPLVASLWIGLGVLIWHLPVLVNGDDPPPIGVAVVAVSVIYAWLYVQGGSIWPLVLLHWVQNYVGGAYLGRIFAPEDSLPWTSVLACGYVLCALVIAWRYGPSLGQHARLGEEGLRSAA